MPHLHDDDSVKIRETLQLYFNSYLSADADGISKAFHAETRLFTVDNDSLDKAELANWLANLRERKEKCDFRQAETEVLYLDVSGPAAMAKVVLRFPKFTFTDYLSLLKIEGDWRIIGKIYTA